MPTDYITPAEKRSKLDESEHGVFTWKLLALVVVMAFLLWVGS